MTGTDLREFIAIIPDWDRYALGLRCLVLGDGGDDCMGWHEEGIICLSAWDGFEQEWDEEFFAEHRHVLERLQVDLEATDDGWVAYRFTRRTAAGFQLMHVLRPDADPLAAGRGLRRGFGNRVADAMWDLFFRQFGF